MGAELGGHNHRDAAGRPCTRHVRHPAPEQGARGPGDGRDAPRTRGGIVWEGTTALHATGTDRITGGTVGVPPDRLEAVVLALAVGITGGTVRLADVPVSLFPAALVAVLADAGVELLPHADGGTLARCPAGPRPVHTAVTSATCSDVQPQLTAFLTRAAGVSRTEERIYTRATATWARRGASVPTSSPRPRPSPCTVRRPWPRPGWRGRTSVSFPRDAECVGRGSDGTHERNIDHGCTQKVLAGVA
ncbi:hypothetical protein ACFW2Y_35610 [Streptomyces sp. NPDC058877]|uniref:hypothetical protein n=1 Tax=unclassified Streptomyces TaxID=2593676 RepID=UPI0036C42696